jgi:hypothetical protein
LYDPPLLRDVSDEEERTAPDPLSEEELLPTLVREVGAEVPEELFRRLLLTLSLLVASLLEDLREPTLSPPFNPDDGFIDTASPLLRLRDDTFLPPDPL